MTAPAIDGQAYIMHKLDGLGRLVEAVDRLSTMIETRFPNDPSTPKSPGFRPLDIEDGQVKESSAEAQLSAERQRFTKSIHEQTFGKVSVPKAEPPEQESQPDPLDEALAYFEKCVRGMENGMCYPLARARKAVFAAAHREYAQPVPKDRGLAFEKALNRLQNTVATLAVSKCMNTPAGFAEIAECRQAVWFAAQPGKGV